MAVDITGITYFTPILAFLIVFAVCFAILFKTKIIGENPYGLIFISLLIAALFVSAGGAIDFVLNIIPWFAVLLVSLFFVMLLVSFTGDKDGFLTKRTGTIVLILVGIVFLVSAFAVFSEIIAPYLPGPTFATGPANPSLLYILDWVYSPRIIGGIILIIFAAIASWFLVKSTK